MKQKAQKFEALLVFDSWHPNYFSAYIQHECTLMFRKFHVIRLEPLAMTEKVAQTPDQSLKK